MYDMNFVVQGISQGDKDLLEHVLMECLGAKIHFGRLHMKPGKPTTFLTWMDKSTKGTTGASNSTKLIFALPGNPVSAIVCSHLVVHPALQLLRCGQLPGINTVQGMARNAAVQSEIDAVLAQDLKLDIERPEYHRVTLQWVSGNAAGQNRIGHFVARSTGVQRSSRLLSMRMADGLACLPQGIRGRKMACKKGETVLVLLLSNRYFAGGATMDVKWMESRHMAIQKRISVGILGRHLSLTQNDLERSVSSSLDRAQIMVTQMDVPVEQKGQFLNSLGADLSDVQLVVVVSGGGFRKDLDVSLAVYSALEKNADAMALHARKIAAADYWLSALFEVTIGWTMGKLVVCIPERGLTAALSSISGMVLHAINTGSGKR